MASTIDRTIPATNAPLESAPVRSNFGAAADDVEALQTGKADTSALNAHTGAANPHSGSASSTDLSNHTGASNPHTGSASTTDLTAHTTNTSNPHTVTAAQVGAPDVTLSLKGELIGYDGGQHVRIPPAGSNALVLSSDTSEPSGVKWETSQFFSPTQAQGDLIVRGGAGTDVRLPLGTANQVLTVKAAGDNVEWRDATGGGATNPPTTPGDLWSHDGVTTQRLAGGTNGQMLYRDTGAPTGLAWNDAPTGTGDVTSASNTGADEVQLGDTPPKGIKGSSAFTFDGNTLGILATNANALYQDLSGPGSAVFIGLRSSDPVNEGRWRMVVSGGFWSLQALMDNASIRHTVARGHHLSGDFQVNQQGYVGNPTGGAPAAGGWNAEALLVNNVPTVVTASDTTDGEVQIGDGGTNHIKGAAFQASDIARLSTANVFTELQEITNGTEAILDTRHTAATANAQRFRLSNANGFCTLTGRNDAGAQVGDALISFGHDNSPAGKGAIIGAVAFPGIGALAAQNGLYDGTNRVYSASAPPTYKVGQTFAIGGTITVSTTLPHSVGVAAGKTCTLVGIRHGLTADTATITVRRNGVALTGQFANVSVTTTRTTSSGTGVTLNDLDDLDINITAAGGSAVGLSVTLLLEYTL